MHTPGVAEPLSESTAVKMTVRQLWAMVAALVLSVTGGTWWLSGKFASLATRDDLKSLDTKVQGLDVKVQTLAVDVAVLKDRGERRDPPTPVKTP